ncbi:hypothetical protein Scep_015192 [Stephania cephalantha]|uniref:Uncharacterized protein n=1 Tax=Stephania cephalantha TaxID=152367 RepID=A0AAP0J598_9MAGN
MNLLALLSVPSFHCSSKTLVFICTKNASINGNPNNIFSNTNSRSRSRVLSSLPSGENSSRSLKELYELELSISMVDLVFCNFCIIEGPETVSNFDKMQFKDIQDNIKSRRNKIFLLMEEVRRLRVQQRIKNCKVTNEADDGDANEMPDIPSSIPFLSNVTSRTLKQLYLTSFSIISVIIVFGGLLAPILELKVGLGGTSYKDFITSVHLPLQLSLVDPIVASFSGGAVGVIAALMLIEVNNVKQQEKKRCKYCHGTGYLGCARCSASGVCLGIEPISITSGSDFPLRAPRTHRCPNCSGAGKVMCTTCLCTGMFMASEHDLRIDPFD